MFYFKNYLPVILSFFIAVKLFFGFTVFLSENLKPEKENIFKEIFLK